MKKFIKYFFIGSVIFIGFAFIMSLFSENTEQSPSANTEEVTESEKPEESANCNFSKAIIKVSEFGTQKTITEKTVNACFNVKADRSGSAEISSKQSNLKIVFINENPLQFLDIVIGENEPTRFRANKGHDIFMVKKGSKLSFIFSDKQFVTGSVIFE